MTAKQWPDIRPSYWRHEDGSTEKGVRITTRKSRVFIPRSRLIELANLAADVFEEGERH